MIPRFAAIALLASFAVTSSPGAALADDKRDATADLLAKLRKPVDLVPGDDLKLQELADLVSDRYGVPAAINTAAFLAAGEENPGEAAVKMPRTKGLALGSTLRQALTAKNATFLVRKGHIEIVPIGFAAKVSKISGNDEDGTVRLAQPLASAIYKE